MATEPGTALAATVALRAPEPLAAFNRAGVLEAADVHVALTLTELAGVADPDVLLAVALAVRAPRRGHVFVDLARVADSAEAEREREQRADAADGADATGPLPWPEPDSWRTAVVAASTLVAMAPAEDYLNGQRASAAADRPLHLSGTRLYLDRYWRQEQALAARLAELGATPPYVLELDGLAGALTRVFADGDPLQRAAAAATVLRRLTVIAGGPGTGKTTTVARAVALLCDQARADGDPPPLIALAAPTGRAAARLLEAVRGEAERPEIDHATREQMLGLRSSTLHRLLGWRPGGRFRHSAANRLPHDVVIVDETSMVSLWLMESLVQAVRGDARLILVGDPDQLAAIEAGAVLRDIVGPAVAGLHMGEGMRALLQRVTGDSLAGAADAERSFGDGVVVLRRSHRFGSAIGELADAIRRGDGDAAVAALAAGPAEIEWVRPTVDAAAEAPPADAARRATSQTGATAYTEQALASIRTYAVGAYTAVIEAARAAEAETALGALARFRLMCAHRTGPYGVGSWTALIESWLADALADFSPGDRDYAGRPLLITANDAELGLHNGDAGVIVAGADGRLTAAFRREQQLLTLAPARLQSIETLYATTIHKAQGSQFATAAVLLPEPDSPLLTRELLYTAVTRAQDRLLLLGAEASIRAAIAAPVERATGLADLLWR